jgi:cobalamin biosynthesis Mg chelatase CobN
MQDPMILTLQYENNLLRKALLQAQNELAKFQYNLIEEQLKKQESELNALRAQAVPPEPTPEPVCESDGLPDSGNQ